MSEEERRKILFEQHLATLKLSLEELKLEAKIFRDSGDAFCPPSSREQCHTCCLTCLNPCNEPRCWTIQTLRACPYRMSTLDVLCRKLDNKNIGTRF